jgi:hypothetical protein
MVALLIVRQAHLLEVADLRPSEIAVGLATAAPQTAKTSPSHKAVFISGTDMYRGLQLVSVWCLLPVSGGALAVQFELRGWNSRASCNHYARNEQTCTTRRALLF